MYGYLRVLLGVILLLCTASRTIVTRFHLSLWPPNQCQAWVPFNVAGLKISHRVVGYYYIICVTVASAYLISRSLLQGCSWVDDDFLPSLVACRVPSRTMNTGQ